MQCAVSFLQMMRLEIKKTFASYYFFRRTEKSNRKEAISKKKARWCRPRRGSPLYRVLQEFPVFPFYPFDRIPLTAVTTVTMATERVPNGCVALEQTILQHGAR